MLGWVFGEDSATFHYSCTYFFCIFCSGISRECRIDNKYLPHGSLDIVCGFLGTDGISIKLGVMVDNDETFIDNPHLVSAKTKVT